LRGFEPLIKVLDAYIPLGYGSDDACLVIFTHARALAVETDTLPDVPRAEASARAPIPQMTQLVAPGDGSLNFARILRLMGANGVAHGYIEIDLADDPLQASRRGLHYLANLEY
jgi:hypothetical protein